MWCVVCDAGTMGPCEADVLRRPFSRIKLLWARTMDALILSPYVGLCISMRRDATTSGCSLVPCVAVVVGRAGSAEHGLLVGSEDHFRRRAGGDHRGRQGGRDLQADLLSCQQRSRMISVRWPREKVARCSPMMDGRKTPSLPMHISLLDCPPRYLGLYCEE